MTKRFVGTLIVVLALAGTTTASASASDFKGYATCGKRPPFGDDRVCDMFDRFRGVFIAKHDDNVRYKLCVTRPPDGKENCLHKKRTGKRGSKSISRPIYHNWPGIYHFKWKVPGRGVVARAKMKLT